MFAESMAHIGYRALLVIREAIYDDCGAVDAIAFIADFFVAHSLEFTSTALDGAGDVIRGHIFFFGFNYGSTQTWVEIDIAAAHASSHSDFFDEFGEYLAALGVLTAFTMLNIRPFGMPCHVLESYTYLKIIHENFQDSTTEPLCESVLILPHCGVYLLLLEDAAYRNDK